MTKKALLAFALPLSALPARAFSLQDGLTGTRDVIAELAKGGNVMWGLLVLSIIALAYTLERILRLKRERFAPKGFAEKADALWKAGQYDELLACCAASDSILARTVRWIVDHREASFQDVK